MNVIPNKYPSGGIDKIEVIPINTLPLSQPTSPVYSIPHRPPGTNKGNVIVVVEESPQYPPYRPNPPHRHHHHRQPHYGKPKQQPIEVIIIEEPRPNPGDTS